LLQTELFPFDDFIASHIYPFRYNNLFIVISAISFFAFVMSFDFYCEKINWAASSCLAAYLIQDGVIKYQWLDKYTDAYSPVVNLVFWISVSLSFFICALLFDKVRYFLMKPVYILINKIKC